MKVIVLILTIFIFNDRSEIKQNNWIILVVVQVMIAVQIWWNIMSLSDIYDRNNDGLLIYIAAQIVNGESVWNFMLLRYMEDGSRIIFIGSQYWRNELV